MAQTTGYGYTSTVAQAGQKVDLTFDRVISRAAEGAVPFGRGVIKGTADDQCKVADSAAGAFLGVSLFTHTAVIPTVGGTAQYDDTDSVSITTDGPVWMEAVGAVTAEADAYVIVAAGANQGRVTATATANLGPVGKFETSGEDEIVTVVVHAKGA